MKFFFVGSFFRKKCRVANCKEDPVAITETHTLSTNKPYS